MTLFVPLSGEGRREGHGTVRAAAHVARRRPALIVLMAVYLVVAAGTPSTPGRWLGAGLLAVAVIRLFCIVRSEARARG